MYCTRCGKEIDYDARFCVECAKEIAYETSLAASRAAEIKAAAAKAEVIKAELAVAEKTAVDEIKAAEPAPGSEYNAQNTAQTPQYTAPNAMVYSPAQACATASAYPADSGPNDAKFGLGKAVASLVMSNVAVLFAYISIFAAIASPGFAFFILFASLPLSIVAMVQGIKSIKIFTSRSRAGYKKPVVTLVLGIVGLATAVLALIIFFIYFFMLIIIIDLYSSSYYYNYDYYYELL